MQPFSVSSSRFVLVIWISKGLSVWLRPSKQIRPPLYSIKQKKQRRWIVSIHYLTSLLIWGFPQIIKYGSIYVSMILLFVVLIALRKPPSNFLRVKSWLTITYSRCFPEQDTVLLLHMQQHIMIKRTFCIHYIHLYFFTLHGHPLCLIMTLRIHRTAWTLLQVNFCRLI